MANLYDTYTKYGDGSLTTSPFGVGAYSPTLAGNGYAVGTPTDPMTTAAVNTPVPLDMSVAGPWGGGTGTGTGINVGGLPPRSPTDSGFGWNLGTLDIALGGLKTIGGLWQAWEQNKNAKKALEYQRKATNANLAAQQMAYNTTLENHVKDNVQAGRQDVWTPEYTKQYLDSHKLDKVVI